MTRFAHRLCTVTMQCAIFTWSLLLSFALSAAGPSPTRFSQWLGGNQPILTRHQPNKGQCSSDLDLDPTDSNSSSDSSPFFLANLTTHQLSEAEAQIINIKQTKHGETRVRRKGAPSISQYSNLTQVTLYRGGIPRWLPQSTAKGGCFLPGIWFG